MNFGRFSSLAQGIFFLISSHCSIHCTRRPVRGSRVGLHPPQCRFCVHRPRSTKVGGTIKSDCDSNWTGIKLQSQNCSFQSAGSAGATLFQVESSESSKWLYNSPGIWILGSKFQLHMFDWHSDIFGNLPRSPMLVGPFQISPTSQQASQDLPSFSGPYPLTTMALANIHARSVFSKAVRKIERFGLAS